MESINLEVSWVCNELPLCILFFCRKKFKAVVNDYHNIMLAQLRRIYVQLRKGHM